MQEEQDCAALGHTIRLTFIVENGTTYAIRNGVVQETSTSYEAEPRDEIEAWCADCCIRHHYDHYREAPDWLQTIYDIAYKETYGDEENPYNVKNQ